MLVRDYFGAVALVPFLLSCQAESPALANAIASDAAPAATSSVDAAVTVKETDLIAGPEAPVLADGTHLTVFCAASALDGAPRVTPATATTPAGIVRTRSCSPDGGPSCRMPSGRMLGQVLELDAREIRPVECTDAGPDCVDVRHWPAYALLVGQAVFGKDSVLIVNGANDGFGCPSGPLTFVRVDASGSTRFSRSIENCDGVYVLRRRTSEILIDALSSDPARPVDAKHRAPRVKARYSLNLGTMKLTERSSP